MKIKNLAFSIGQTTFSVEDAECSTEELLDILKMFNNHESQLDVKIYKQDVVQCLTQLQMYELLNYTLTKNGLIDAYGINYQFQIDSMFQQGLIYVPVSKDKPFKESELKPEHNVITFDQFSNKYLNH